MKAETKYKGSIKLAAIGDALGWITEFEKSSENLQSKYGSNYITSFHNWKKNVGGRFNGYVDSIKAGSYSDDTQLLLAVARSIKKDGIIDQEYFSKTELPNWLLYSRGAGRTIKNAARKIERKSAKWNNNFFTFKAGKTTIDYRESGANGAAMRILPIALANFGDPDKIKKEIFANSIITHGHPRAIIGAMLYGYAIDTILRFNPENFKYTAFLTELGKDIHTKLSIPFIAESKFMQWEYEWNKKAEKSFRELFEDILSEAQEYLRYTYKLIANNISDLEALSKLGCYKNETKGSGTSTVIAGIFLACKYSKEPLKGIEQAVNSIGTDTDSIAAFAGGLIGALHGQEIIPSKWKSVQDFDYLDKVSDKLLEISENSTTLSNIKYNKELKSLNKINFDNFKEYERVNFSPLGVGTIMEVNRQKTLTKGKFNLILKVDFEIGQSCVFGKLLNLNDQDESINFTQIVETNVDLLNTLNLEIKTKQKIDDFIEKLSEENRKVFREILEIIAQKIKN